jgi:hypothetical protein
MRIGTIHRQSPTRQQHIRQPTTDDSFLFCHTTVIVIIDHDDTTVLGGRFFSLASNIYNMTSQDFLPSVVLALNPVAIRERVKSIPTCQELPGQGEFVLSFLVIQSPSPEQLNGMEKDKIESKRYQYTNNNSNTNAARVNIFVDSGTIGTCRVMLNGKLRQSFRRNVTSLDVVERLLR